MASFVSYPQLMFQDAYSQPSDTVFGRRLSVYFDSSNVYTTTDGYYSLADTTTLNPVVVRVYGTTTEGPDHENFTFTSPATTMAGVWHFTSFDSIQIVSGIKIYISDPYGVVEVKELMPVNYLDDGYVDPNPYVEFVAYGSGLFLFETTLKDAYGKSVDLGYGAYEFDYGSPFQIVLSSPPETIFVGNSTNLEHAADGILDEIKITSSTATKARTRTLAGSYDISVEASNPVFSEPDAKTLTLLHLDDNTQDIIDALREPLDSANLSDSVLATIVSLRNDRDSFINYVNSLHITGSIVDESLDTRDFSAQLYDLVEVLNGTINSAEYYRIAGLYQPSEIVVNDNFEFAAVFSGEEYKIEKPGLINDDHGSIEVWIAPLVNLLGDFKRRVYLDAINHAIIGADGNFVSITANLIKFPNNISARQINSIKLAGDAGKSNTFDFLEFAVLSGDGTNIVLAEELPSNNTAIIVDYIPQTASNDRLTLFKDEGSNLVFAISASGTLYQTSHNISDWKQNEWHRVMLTWRANDKNNLDHLNMYVDGIQSSIIKYGEGYLYNTFVYKQEHQIDVNTKVLPQNIQFIGKLDALYVGTDFLGAHQALCRMANLRVSFIERQPVIDARGFKIDFDFDGGSKSATPEVSDGFTTYLEDFDPKAGFITNFASAQDPVSGIHDLHIIVRDNFHLVRGVNNGQVERLLRELLKIIKPAEARTRITITTGDKIY